MSDSHWSNIHTVVINLPKEKARRAFMEDQLTRLSIPYRILEATDGRDYNFTGLYDEKHAVRLHGRPLTAAEKGCAHSHKRALEEFIASGKEYGLILEDDVVLEASFPKAVNRVLRTQGWSYVQFNYSPVGWSGVRLWWFLLMHNRSLSPLRLALSVLKGIGANALSVVWGLRDAWYRMRRRGKLCKLVRDHYLAGCYLLTREAAEALIRLNTPLTYTADRVQNIARRAGYIKERIYVPRLVRQKREEFASSINNEHFGEEVISY